jgi:CYTH domain-containing protein
MASMGVEIERKFLVVGHDYRKHAAGVSYRQGYLTRDPERTVRVRVAGGRAYLTIKGRGQGLARPEFEYEIPVGDATTLLDTLCLKPLVEKTRFELTVGGTVWVVDEFKGENAGLVVAEVELAAEDQPFAKPAWLGEEVSDDARYTNASLSAKPFRTW